MLGRVVCFVGLHKWSKWGWEIEASYSCTQVKTCQYCGAKVRNPLIKHSFGEWKYQPPDLCIQVRTCNQCNHSENRSSHNWDEWRYVDSDSCHQERVCQKCGDKETQLAKHIWSPWEYETPNSCTQIRACTRCKGNESRVFHEWGEWKYQSEGKERFCLRCNASDYEADIKDEFVYPDPNACPLCGTPNYDGRYCNGCGHFPGDDHTKLAR